MVATVIFGLLLKRSIVTPRYRHESSASERAAVRSNVVTQDASTTQRKSPAGPAASASVLTALSQDQRPDGSANRRIGQEALPEAMQASVVANFPGYRVPEGKDITGGWAIDKQPGAFSFLCRGDFNGDGVEDAAVILIGQQSWRLVIFENNSLGQYRPAFVARPKNKAELGKYWENQILSAPQQLIIRTVKKGETWAPEADDDPNLGRLKVDSIEMVAKPIPNAYFSSLVIFEGGKYQQVYLDPLVELPADAPR